MEINMEYIYIITDEESPFIASHNLDTLLNLCDEYYGANEKWGYKGERLEWKEFDDSEFEESLIGVLTYKFKGAYEEECIESLKVYKMYIEK